MYMEAGNGQRSRENGGAFVLSMMHGGEISF